MKIRSLTKAEMDRLNSQLNAYTRGLDTPAKVEGLHVNIKGDKIRSSFRLVPLGDMDAVQWNEMNENLEKTIRRFVKQMSKVDSMFK